MLTRLSLALASSLLVLSCSGTEQASEQPPTDGKATAAGEAGKSDADKPADAAKADGAKADGAKPEAARARSPRPTTRS